MEMKFDQADATTAEHEAVENVPASARDAATQEMSSIEVRSNKKAVWIAVVLAIALAAAAAVVVWLIAA